MYQGQSQQPLPGAYYGPAVPPPARQSESRDCFCCLFGTAVKIFLSVMILLAILAIVLWLVLRPTEIKAYVTTASLTQFNLTNVGNGGRNLQHNLTTAVTIRNPNKRVGIYYDYLEANAYYEDQRFGWRTFPSFYQGSKTNSTLYPSFSGTSLVYLSNSDLNDFELQRQAATFEVTLRLRGRIRYKIGSSFKTSRNTLKINCFMAIPYAASGANGRTGLLGDQVPRRLVIRFESGLAMCVLSFVRLLSSSSLHSVCNTACYIGLFFRQVQFSEPTF